MVVRHSDSSRYIFITISLPPAVILLSSQPFGRSVRLVLVLPSNIRFHEIIYRIPEKIRLAYADINGIP